MGAITQGSLQKNTVCRGVERVMELTQSINNLQDTISLCNSLASRLEGKLQPILTCGLPIRETTDRPRGYETEMANRVDDARAALSNIADALESVLERIEL